MFALPFAAVATGFFLVSGPLAMAATASALFLLPVSMYGMRTCIQAACSECSTLEDGTNDDVGKADGKIVHVLSENLKNVERELAQLQNKIAANQGEGGVQAAGEKGPSDLLASPVIDPDAVPLCQRTQLTF